MCIEGSALQALVSLLDKKFNHTGQPNNTKAGIAITCALYAKFSVPSRMNFFSSKNGIHCLASLDKYLIPFELYLNIHRDIYSILPALVPLRKIMFMLFFIPSWSALRCHLTSFFLLTIAQTKQMYPLNTAKVWWCRRRQYALHQTNLSAVPFYLILAFLQFVYKTFTHIRRSACVDFISTDRDDTTLLD